jgi:hypothetical protein
MEASRQATRSAGRKRQAKPQAVVWVDAREAVIASGAGATLELERLESDVPAHRKSTGHIRHDPGLRHGGGASQTAGDRRRLEGLARFLARIQRRISPASDLLVIGPGPLHERLVRAIRGSDRRHRIDRLVRHAAAGRMTARQLVARLRAASGDLPRRRIPGRR